MHPATSVILAFLGLALIWLPATLDDASLSGGTLLSNLLASVGLLILIGILKVVRRRR